ncbi:MAG TPA: alpha/beta fold hydrolase [Caulobacteraceae bacterium]|nr:alpha/beta fold hydrolase [Caulobacteraceae bacterium]
MPRLVFAHGWGLDRTLWDAVLAELGDLAAGAIVLDSGYYGRPAGAGALNGARVLGVGQSMGALELLACPPGRLCGLVAIDAFARFAAAPDFPAGQDERKLRLMARRLDQGPRALVAEFLERSLRGVAPPIGEPDRDALARGLDRLLDLDGRAAVKDLPIWRLHAAQDPIAPLALADASFAPAQERARQVREGGDHLSPLTAPETCAALIRTAVQALRL